jgi:hypothetical protein
VPALRLRVAVSADGASVTRAGPVVVEVACADGSAGRAVLGIQDVDAQDLPQPLSFAEPTTCRVNVPAAGGADDASFEESAVFEPAARQSTLTLPATVTLDRAGTEYRVTVSRNYRPAAAAGPEPDVGSWRILPAALIGSGMIGIGALLILMVLLRRRSVY